MTNYRKTMAEALIEVFAEELSPDEIAKEQSKAIDQFNDDMAKEFPKEKFTARANVSPLGGGIAFEFGVIPAKDAKGVDLLNAPAHSKFMMHLTDNKNKAVPMSKFSIGHIMGRLPVKFRKVTGKSPTDAVKKLVDWFKKNKRDFEGLVVEELDLDEGKKETWMKKAQDAVKKAGGNTGKMDWDSATYLYNTGKSPEEAGEQLAKLQKEEVELDEGYEKTVLLALKDEGIKGHFRNDVLYVAKRDIKDAKDAIKAAGHIKSAPKIVGEEVELDEALKKGAKVEVPHKGKRTQGTVVRYVPQRGAASPYYVVYVGEYESIEVPAHKIKEEVELDEANYEIKNGKVHISKKEFAKVSKDYKGKDTMTVLDPKTGATVNMPVVFEEVELDEVNLKQKVIATIKDKGEPDRYGNPPLPAGNLLKYIEKIHGIQGVKIAKKLDSKRFEEVELDEWPVSDMKLLAQKLTKRKVNEGKMSDLHLLIKQGKSAEEIAKIMKVDAKTIKKLMVGYKESARSDAMKAMKSDPDMKQRGFSKDISATDADLKGASKNIIMQMRKVISLRGKFEVEFLDGKKIKIPEKLAQSVQDKYDSFRRTIDKEKFQAKVAKSYKSMLTALKESFLNEKSHDATEFECLECGKKFKKKIGRHTVDVKCPKCGGYDVEIAEEKTNQNRILGLISDKIRENKNG